MTLPTDRDELIGGALGRSLYELLRLRLIRELLVPSPAAGAEWSLAMPAGVYWELLDVRALLTTSAVVATRTPRLRVSDPNNIDVQRFGVASAASASSAVSYEWSAGLGMTNNTAATAQGLPTPPQAMLPGFTISSLTGNLDAGDQWSSIVLLVREWSIAAVQANLDWLGSTLR